MVPYRKIITFSLLASLLVLGSIVGARLMAAEHDRAGVDEPVRDMMNEERV